MVRRGFAVNGSFPFVFLDEYKRLNIDPLGKSKIFIISSSVFSNDINKARSYPLVHSFISKPLSVEKIKEMFEADKAL